MKIGLIDVDNCNKMGKCFPNLALMKLSAYHKSIGDSVEWYDPMFSGHCDIVYMSKVFSFSNDYPFGIDADKVIKGGSGYCIKINPDGKEFFDASLDHHLPDEIEHIYPDYSIYGITDTAYGFITRGCPRGCGFCIVKNKEGLASRKVANVSEFWNGQKNIECLDPNVLACREYEDVLQQLADTKAMVNFNQGMDIRFLDDKRLAALKKVRMNKVHFAWDRYEDKEIIVPRLDAFAKAKMVNSRRVNIFCLCNFSTTIDQDIERIMTIRSFGFSPYMMIYEKYKLPKNHILRRMQRWVNNRFVFWACESFDEYQKKMNLKTEEEGTLKCL